MFFTDELEHPPHWLTGRDVDQLVGEHLADFDDKRKEFMTILESQERLLSAADRNECLHTSIRNKTWENGTFFYFHALDNIVGLSSLFFQHLQPRFDRSQLTNTVISKQSERIMSPYWGSWAD